MSEENPVKFPSIDELKKLYKERLDRILYRELTPKNITTFADDALNDLIALNEDILEQYRNNPDFVLPTTKQKVQQQENDAYAQLELENIQEILEAVDKVGKKIKSMQLYVENQSESVGVVITPPERRGIKTGSGAGMPLKPVSPRLLTLVYLLDTDLEISKEGVLITYGTVTPDMMRKTPYVRVEVPELNRVVYICDEEGNASYIFDTKELEKHGLSLEDIDIDSKEDKNILIDKYPGIGIRVMHRIKNWRHNILNAISGVEGGISVNRSEFSKKKWLSYEDFIREVKAAYEAETGEKGDLTDWYFRYRKENNKELVWPSHYNKIYGPSGFKNFREIVGLVFISFEQFKKEVKAAYEAETGEKRNIFKWYSNYRIANGKELLWPGTPNKTYRNEGKEGEEGFVNFREIVGRGWLLYEDFRSEVKAAYDSETGEKGDVLIWFNKYRKEHGKELVWPSSPIVQYRKFGFTTLTELVGIK